MAGLWHVAPGLTIGSSQSASSDETYYFVSGATYNFVRILPIEWGDTNPGMTFSLGKRRISDVQRLHAASGDVHLYLKTKLFET